MKRIFFLFLCLPVMLAQISAPAEEAPAFSIDEQHIYDKMARSYAQGYHPLVEQNKAHIVLPLLPDGIDGDIEAEFIPADAAISPVKLPQALKQKVSKKTFTFGQEKVSAYLVYFKFNLYPDSENGDYPYTIRLSGKDAKGQIVSRDILQTLHIRDGQTAAQPRVSLEAFKGGQDFLVGESGVLALDLRNESGHQTLSGLRLSFSDPSGDILPLESDNLALEDIEPLETRRVELPLQVLAKASAQPRAVALELSYSYAGGLPGSLKQNLTIDIKQEARLSYTEPQLPARLTQGETAAFTMTFMNMGKGALNNVRMTFTLPGLASGGTILVGNIDPGESRQGSANLRAASDYLGDTKGTMTVDYEDGYGKSYSKELPLSGTIEEKKKIVFEDQEKKEEEKGMALREIIAWGLAGLLTVLLIAQAVILRGKIHKLEERNL